MSPLFFALKMGVTNFFLKCWYHVPNYVALYCKTIICMFIAVRTLFLYLGSLFFPQLKFLPQCVKMFNCHCFQCHETERDFEKSFTLILYYLNAF
jgi:hypothetical protein